MHIQDQVRKGYDEFLQGYQPEQARQLFAGQSLLGGCLSSAHPRERARIAHRLLDDGADASFVQQPEHLGVLVIMFGAQRVDVDVDLPLARRLLQNGADVNLASPRHGHPLTVLAGQFQVPSDQLQPLFDLLLTRPELDLAVPDREGRTVIESLRKMARLRPLLVAAAERHPSLQPS